jgi:glycosyltransferase involved in cell wall biosynthesis
MKIGIDARLYGQAGPGRYISNLIKELEKIDEKNDYIIFITKKDSEVYHPKNPRFKKWVVDIPWYSAKEQFSFLMDLLRARLDLLHVPHFNIPIFYPGKMVVTIHDLIMGNSRLGEATNLPFIKYMYKKAGYLLVTNAISFKAKKIIVPSENSKEELISKLKYIKKDNIQITYEGVDQDLLDYKIRDDKVIRTYLEEMGIGGKYILYVGSAYPHKNLKTLIISFKDIVEKGNFNGQLVIAGKVDKFSERLAGFAHALKLGNKVIFAAKYSENNYVTDKDLAYLYQGALAYVFPSLEEGFSITPLEAQAFDVPVLLSDIPTHREVFGDSALYFDPGSNIDLSKKMKLIIKDFELRRKLIDGGIKNVKKYSWANMAKETLKVYNSVLNVRNK